MDRPLLLRIVTCTLLAALAAPGFAQDKDETYYERLEYDPDSGEWKEIPPPIPGTEAGDLALARSLLARGEYDAARAAFKDWFKKYPNSTLYNEALFYAAETEVSAEDADDKNGDLIQAYEWLEELLEASRGTDLADRAIRKELIIAEMLLFKDRKVRKLKGTIWLSGEDEALDMLNRVADMWAPDTPLAEQALRIKADYHFLTGEYEEAETNYARLMRDFPRGRYHKVAMLRSGQSALARFPGVEYDEADLLEAEVYFRDFQREYPQEAAEYQIPQTLDRLTESLAQKEYTVGRFYERVKKIDAAAFYYRYVARAFPHTTWAAEAEGRLVALGATDVTSHDLGDLGPPADPAVEPTTEPAPESLAEPSPETTDPTTQPVDE